MNRRYMLRSEDTEQMNVIDWCRWRISTYPELKWLHHCPNGGSRDKQEAVKLKAMGVLAGVPDLHLPVPKGKYIGLYIEMKYADGRLQDSQKEFLKAAAGFGHFCAVCYGAEEATSVIEEYLKLKPIDTGEGENRMHIENCSILKEGKVKQL